MDDRPPSPTGRQSERVEDCLKALREAISEQTRSPIYGVCAIFMGATESGKLPILCYQIDEKLDTPQNMRVLADFFNRFTEEHAKGE